jgi:hypothetical protein
MADNSGGTAIPVRYYAMLGQRDLHKWAMRLPEPWNKYVSSVVTIPLTIWTALLLVWLIYGIAFRTVPLAVGSNDPLVLLRGRKRVNLACRVSTVLHVTETEKTTVHHGERIVEDSYGNRTRYPTEDRQSTHHLRAFIRDDRGNENTIDLVDMRVAMREGHRVLEVWEVKTKHYLLLHNYDLRRSTFMPYMQRLVRLHPFILLPLWIVATLIGDMISPQTGVRVLFATPFVYLIFMWIVNAQRSKQFQNQIAPLIIASAAKENPSAQIGTAELGISPA